MPMMPIPICPDCGGPQIGQGDTFVARDGSRAKVLQTTGGHGSPVRALLRFLDGPRAGKTELLWDDAIAARFPWVIDDEKPTSPS